MNPREQPLTLRAGTTIGTVIAVDTQQILNVYPEPVDSVTRISGSPPDRNTVPEYLQPLINATKENCQRSQETQMLAELLTWYIRCILH